MVRYDVAYSPDEVKKWKESGGWGGYTAIGNFYTYACEKEFNFFEIVFYSVFPKTKQEWDENKRQELQKLVFRSHEQAIRVAFDNPQLGVIFEGIVDNNKENPDDQSYFYWTSDDYLVEINGSNSRIKNIRCDNCHLDFNKSVLSDEELEKVYIGFIQRIEPIFTQNHWLETWERYTIHKKGDNTFFRLNSKTEKLTDRTPAYIQIGLDQFGNLLNYANVQK